MGIVVDHNLWVWRRLFVRYVLCVENVVSGVVGGGCFDCDDCGG